MCVFYFFFFKQKTAYEMRISDWSSDVCSSDLHEPEFRGYAEVRVWPFKQVNRTDGQSLAGLVVDPRDCPDRRRPGRYHAADHSRGAAGVLRAVADRADQIGRASGRERVCQYV